MFRRRTALSVTAAALLAAPLLSACGSDSHPGAAAVVDGRKITVAQLQARVKDVRAAQSASPQGADLVRGSGQLGLAVLNRMVFDRVVTRAAKDSGVTANTAQVEKLRGQVEKSAGGARQLAAGWLQQQAIAPDEIDTALREQLLMDGIARHLGVDRSTPQGQRRLVDTLSRASKAMRIDVNPRYGMWNDKQVVLGQAKEGWIKPSSGTAEAAGAPVQQSG